jgi:hypothetical protein
MPEELIQHLVQVAILSTFAAPSPPPVTTRTTAAVATALLGWAVRAYGAGGAGYVKAKCFIEEIP